MTNSYKKLQEALEKQNIKDFNKLKWELNEKLSNLDPADLPRSTVSNLNNMFSQIINRLKQYNK